MKYVVIAICAVIIVVRSLWPEVRFDNISLILLIVAAFPFLLSEFRGVLGRVKKVKVGDFEVELAEKLNALAGKTEAVELSVSQEDRQPLDVEQPRDDNVASWLVAAGSDPRASLVLLAVEIEKTVCDLAVAADIPESRRPLLSRHISVLAQRGVLNQQIVPLFREFWAIRNLVVHGQHFELSEGKLYELLELGIRIVRLLRAGSGRVADRSE